MSEYRTCRGKVVVAQPLIVDELGALAEYITDSGLRRRIEAALGLRLSRGAGLGILVVGALQDPRKENLDLRDLFVPDPARRHRRHHVDMVLGDGT
jgi:S-DNA-T family DNA segregation ATPase FtsK/SpoIIIE